MGFVLIVLQPMQWNDVSKFLCNKQSAQWILEGDIRACFDKISHDWLLENIPMDSRILKQWLKAGFIEKQTIFPNQEVGINFTSALLTWLLISIRRSCETSPSMERVNRKSIRYVTQDDSVITGLSRELLENEIKTCNYRISSGQRIGTFARENEDYSHKRRL